MEDQVFLTEEEDLLASQLVNAIYYPNTADLPASTGSLQKLPKASQEKVVDSVTSSVTFHQKTRERYIMAEAFDATMQEADPRILILRLYQFLATGSSGESSAALNEAQQKMSSNAELSSQVKLWGDTERAMRSLRATLLLAFTVSRVFNLINNYSDEELAELSQLCSSTVLGLDSEEDLRILSDVPLPKNLSELLVKGKLMPFIKVDDSTGEVAEKLTLLLVVSTSIIKNRKTNALTAEQLPQAISELLAHTTVSTII